MKSFTTLTTLAALLSTSLALPSSTPRTPDPTYWQISDFSEGCSPGGCTYSFSISLPSGDQEPSFSTHCSGTDVQNEFKACDPSYDQYISSNAVPVVGGNLTVVVQHKWSEGEATYWVEGNTTIASGADGSFPTDFIVQQSIEYAVAK